MSSGTAVSVEAHLRSGQVLLMITAVGWGLNWAVLKFVLQDWPPLFARGVAGLLGAVGLALVAGLRGEAFAVPRHARLRLAVAAVVNVFAWMGFTALSLNWLKVSEGALIAYSMPIWAMLIAWPLHGERPNRRSLLALILGIAGIVVLMGGPDLAGGKLPGVLFAAGAAILFAFGTVTAREPIAMSPTALTAWQVALGCLPMVMLGLFLERPQVSALSAPGLSGLVYMAVGPMALCYLTWFGALRRLPGSVAATGMLLVPIVGTLAAVPLLGDTLGARELGAMVLTLSGVGLALRRSS
ncbi:Permease of the drug/metabolite transporter (DMT) superfamily OS=Bosea thiooxidans OX=53254 GN=SAMN05660750_02291 PE=4 SV=1 [Bosea thiooxidans]|jgi:drug/metabolite transporter (DMT)-like permease|uniref:Permease of the drug/metabolite transporter (DMT) superfamily n=1 Tax=Bosea thiooxidans TaxID=53254 RepID=A0A1T5E286_9HYPH|nr:DMT family transporter [Bosea thiooxidans]SKB77969.1 Permease of the drug/metabolite transporter (DMT) superfamily [Bosea thiooxidans]